MTLMVVMLMQQFLIFIKENRSIVATMDRELKNKIKQSGSSILSIHNDKIILEN